MHDRKSHIVNKLLIDISLPSKEEPDKNMLSDRVSSLVISGLESFSQNHSGRFQSKTLRIDQLTLEITLEKSNLGNLQQEIEKQLLEKLSKTKSAGTTFRGKDDRPEIKEVSSGEKLTELFSHFLNNGTFPWWADSASALSELENRILKLSPAEWRRICLPLFKKTPSAIPRLTNQFPEKTVKKMIRMSLPDEHAFKKNFGFMDEFTDFSQKSAAGLSEKLKTRLYQQIFRFVLDMPAKIDPSASDRLIKSLLNITRQYLPDDIFEKWEDQISQSETFREFSWIKPAEKTKKKTSGDKESSVSEMDNHDQKSFADPEKSEEYDITQAGLVLLHPFIHNLFEKTGYLEAGLFRSRDLKERAVCLLHYLATGEDEFPEPSLVLPMFLCSWQIGVPVNRFLPISDYEKEECHQLLKSATEHWQALKNTSPDGLRVNFLKRNGRLKKSEFGWTLFVENQFQDVLIDQLPWGISALKFKWMSELLTINWRNS